ncbi:MAG: hypothetical protein ACOX6Y_02485 [Christensenellales bacterium]|jgi:hypothetical protein
MNDQLKQAMDRHFAALEWDDGRSRDVLRQVRGETKVKKKMSFSLVMAMTLILMAGIAVAAVTLSRAPAVDAVSRARQALADQYGLTPATLGVFCEEEKREGEGWVVTFTGDGMPQALIGSYTVTLKKDAESVAAWSHDGADQALLDSGSLDSPAWGVKQIQKCLVDIDAKEAAIHRHMEQNPGLFKGLDDPAVITPAELKEGESLRQGEVWQDAAPGPEGLTREKALEIAQAALMEEFALSREDMERAELTDALHRVATDGSAVWSLHYYVVVDGVELGLGVQMDARTGEILSIGITTGGNG